MERKLGVRVLRRSHCIKLVLHGEMSSHDIELDMQHRDGQGYLQRRVYTAEIPPSMHLKHPSSRWQGSVVQDGLTNLHAMPSRPKAADIADDVLADLAAKVEALNEVMTRNKAGDRNDAHADVDEGEEVRLSAEDIEKSTEGRELVEAYSAIACGASYTWSTERRNAKTRIGDVSKKERGPDYCVACGEAPHVPTYGSVATSWRDVDDCLCRREGLRLCPFCGCAFEEEEREEHYVTECFEAWKEMMMAAKGSTTTDNCRVDVPSPLPSPFATSYLCPFTSCVEGCESPNEWLGSIKRTTRGMLTFTVEINDESIIESARASRSIFTTTPPQYAPGVTHDAK